MSQELIYFGITTAITIALGIISYFLKRTMDRSDKLEETVQELKESQFTLSDKYASDQREERRADRREARL